MPPKKSCIINPKAGRAVVVGGATYKKLIKDNTLKKDIRGFFTDAKPKEPKKKKEKTPEEKVQMLNEQVKKLEKEISEAKDDVRSNKALETKAKKLKELRLEWLRARKEMKKKNKK